MTPASDAPSVSGLAPLMFWRWFPGMGVRQVKLLPLPELKIAWAVSGAKLPARLTFSVSGFTSVQKPLVAWDWPTRILSVASSVVRIVPGPVYIGSGASS